MRIDVVSDVVCPWCAVGVWSLDQALARIGPGLDVQLHFQPFELNPQMPPEGEDIVEHLSHKYGINAEQIQRNQQALHARGAALGFKFGMGKRTRIWNTFDAHRLLHWAGLQSAAAQGRLKRALLVAYHGEGRNPGDAAVLREAAVAAGLDGEQAAQVLASGAYADEVREREAFYTQAGINGVPAVIIDEKHLIQGGQPPEVFEQALRQLANAG